MPEPGSAAADSELLRLAALDAEDLAIISAHCQDAVLKVVDLHWRRREQRFVMTMNRFAWEAAAGGSWLRREYQRRRSVLHFDRVQSVKSSGIGHAARNAVLSLLAIAFEPRQEPSGDVVLTFAGGGAIRLNVECVEAQLTDLGPAWATPHAPRHLLR